MNYEKRIARLQHLEYQPRFARLFYKPGQKSPWSGEYMAINPRGFFTWDKIELGEGKRFPPTSGKGYSYLLIDPIR
ncbi:MAG TPA: hypothetical protein DCP31_16735 [Cyanobacteria bacterium UBA8543]|nr:hypothetical protein [Cyanobacteria bacterium UBA8543]